MTNLKIREATLSDAEYIALLGRITFTETFGELFVDQQDLLDYCDQTFSVSKIRNGIQKSNNVFWLAFWDDLPVGYAKLKLDSPSQFIESSSIAQLQKIYVLKDFLSMKIGLKLQNILIEKARQQPTKMIWLSVLRTNERAVRFYRKNEFSKVGEFVFEIGKQAFEFDAMAKLLNDN